MIVDVLGDIDPEVGWSRAVAKQIAKSTKIARRRKKNSWAILHGNPGVHVNIGQRTICEMDQNTVILIVNIADFTRSGRKLGQTSEVFGLAR